MKKLIALAVVAAVAATMIGCGPATPTGGSKSTPASTPATTK